MFSDERINQILSVGRSLSDDGVNNWALTREQALQTVDSFAEGGFSISGGDVYVANQGKLESNYDNWYCERNSSEGDQEFSERSLNKAKEYISSYGLSDALFVIVPG